MLWNIFFFYEFCVQLYINCYCWFQVATQEISILIPISPTRMICLNISLPQGSGYNGNLKAGKYLFRNGLYSIGELIIWLSPVSIFSHQLFTPSDVFSEMTGWRKTRFYAGISGQEGILISYAQLWSLNKGADRGGNLV